MTLTEFINQYTGKSNAGDTPENMGQCVGLSMLWLDNLGLNTPHLFGNACDLLTNADKNKFDIILNAPTNVPQVGDVMVWGKAFNGTYGHTGIFCSGDTNSFNCFEQNDPIGSTPHAKTYTYNGVIGWLHPKPPSNAPTVTLSQADIDALREARDNNWNLHLADQITIKQLQAQIADLSKRPLSCPKIDPRFQNACLQIQTIINQL